jgi:hypothetical protein
MRRGSTIACVGLAIGVALPTKVFAADAAVSHRAHRASSVAPRAPAPLALRTVSRRSASVLASMPCWNSCTTQCGAGFQACLAVDWLAGCVAANNQCELSCLKQCRLSGGPLVSWTDY